MLMEQGREFENLQRKKVSLTQRIASPIPVNTRAKLQRELEEVQKRLQECTLGESDRERKTQTVIDSIEAGYPSWLDTMNRNIAHMGGLPPHLIQQIDRLAAPFQFIKENMKYSRRNFATLEAEARRKGAQIQIAINNPHFFHYDTSPPLKHGYNVTFYKHSRHIDLPENFDVKNPLEFSILSHELHHVYQDSAFRMRYANTDAFRHYLALLQGTETLPGSVPGRGCITLNEEVDAYAFQLEFINILTRGALGNGSDPATVARLLPARPDQMHDVNRLCTMAQHYYPHAMTGGGCSRKFVQHIAQIHAGKYNIITMRPDGTFEVLA